MLILMQLYADDVLAYIATLVLGNNILGIIRIEGYISENTIRKLAYGIKEHVVSVYIIGSDRRKSGNCTLVNSQRIH